MHVTISCCRQGYRQPARVPTRRVAVLLRLAGGGVLTARDATTSDPVLLTSVLFRPQPGRVSRSASGPVATLRSSGKGPPAASAAPGEPSRTLSLSGPGGSTTRPPSTFSASSLPGEHPTQPSLSRELPQASHFHSQCRHRIPNRSAVTCSPRSHVSS